MIGITISVTRQLARVILLCSDMSEQLMNRVSWFWSKLHEDNHSWVYYSQELVKPVIANGKLNCRMIVIYAWRGSPTPLKIKPYELMDMTWFCFSDTGISISGRGKQLCNYQQIARITKLYERTGKCFSSRFSGVLWFWLKNLQLPFELFLAKLLCFCKANALCKSLR